jgi:hypothetical protein
MIDRAMKKLFAKNKQLAASWQHSLKAGDDKHQ